MVLAFAQTIMFMNQNYMVLTSKYYPCHGKNSSVLESSSNCINDEKNVKWRTKIQAYPKIYFLLSQVEIFFGKLSKGSIYGLVEFLR